MGEEKRGQWKDYNGSVKYKEGKGMKITSILLTGEYTLGLDQYGRFTLGEPEGMAKDVKINIKDVPFVRYRLEEYNQGTVEFIKRTMGIFKYSAHMVEIPLSEEAGKIVEMLMDDIWNLITYIYVPVDDKQASEGISDDALAWLEKLNGADVDRIMIKDNSSILNLVYANEIKRQIAGATGFKMGDIGICSSPLSFTGGEACLTAATARKLSAEYSEHDEVALPTAGHESMDRCGCIQYVEINRNLPTIVGVSSKVRRTNKGASKTKVGRRVIPRLGSRL